MAQGSKNQKKRSRKRERRYGKTYGRARLRDNKADNIPDVYVVHMTGTTWYKIGYSTSVQRRVAALQTGSPVKIRVHRVFRNGGQQLEKKLHLSFASRRLLGEWFDLNDGHLADLDEFRWDHEMETPTPVRTSKRPHTVGRCMACQGNVSSAHDYEVETVRHGKNRVRHATCPAAPNPKKPPTPPPSATVPPGPVLGPPRPTIKSSSALRKPNP